MYRTRSVARAASANAVVVAAGGSFVGDSIAVDTIDAETVNANQVATGTVTAGAIAASDVTTTGQVIVGTTLTVPDLESVPRPLRPVLYRRVDIPGNPRADGSSGSDTPWFVTTTGNTAVNGLDRANGISWMPAFNTAPLFKRDGDLIQIFGSFGLDRLPTTTMFARITFDINNPSLPTEFRVPYGVGPGLWEGHGNIGWFCLPDDTPANEVITCAGQGSCLDQSPGLLIRIMHEGVDASDGLLVGDYTFTFYLSYDP